MLTSQQNVPCIVFMQISAAIIEKSILYIIIIGRDMVKNRFLKNGSTNLHIKLS